MSRTMSVFDDGTNITASITVDDSDGGHRTTEIRFTAGDGASVTANDLHLLTAFGLTLPANVLTPLPEAPVSAAPKAVITGKAPTQKRPEKKRQSAKKRPGDDALLQLWNTHKGVKLHMAKVAGCHSTTMAAWINEAKARGTEFPETDR